MLLGTPIFLLDVKFLQIKVKMVQLWVKINGVSHRLKAALHFKILFCTVQLYLQENYCKIHWSNESNASTIRVLKFTSVEPAVVFRSVILNFKKFTSPKQADFCQNAFLYGPHF